MSIIERIIERIGKINKFFLEIVINFRIWYFSPEYILFFCSSKFILMSNSWPGIVNGPVQNSDEGCRNGNFVDRSCKVSFIQIQKTTELLKCQLIWYDHRKKIHISFFAGKESLAALHYYIIEGSFSNEHFLWKQKTKFYQRR